MRHTEKTVQKTMATIKKHSEFSPYKVHWAIFTPTTGKVVTKKDEKTLSGHSYVTKAKAMKYYAKHFNTKEDALEFIQNFNGKLENKYKVRLLTDKQFGMTKITVGELPEFSFTDKQLKEVYYI
ncbi:hypothetical protein CTM62_06345 [Prevotella intermedia]|uniref:Uncharacterized protein n=2 Tax=Prevotella intermedia TaxID=28131 RepID=A0A2D3L737_PREIN|nr:hypothetical protein CTM62_06345 [Prevotella intermedia]